MKRIIVAFGVCVLFIMVCGNIVFAAENTGSIKGTVTWQYNDFVGTKGDVGAKIELIPKDFDVNSISAEAEDSWLIKDESPDGSGIFVTCADGYGNYEINGIPAGSYMLIIVSKQTTRDVTIEPQREPFTNYVRNWDKFKIGIFGIGKYMYKYVTIKEGITSVMSYDFGNTYF